MAYQYENIDACTIKATTAAAETIFAGLIGANYKRAGETDTHAGTATPASGERGYLILQDNPRLADGFDINSPGTNYVARAGGKSPMKWYVDARSAWYNGINRTHNPTFTLCQPGSTYSVADPIAQSFFVVGQTVMLTKVDVYFRRKDPNLPVFLDIRKNIAGVPGPEVIPFSSVLLEPDLISVSEDSSVPTTFAFNGLVHLEEGEYSIVLRSDSTIYEVWVSVVNEVDVLRKVKINTQPTLGSLYKSQNLSTWTPDQTADMKFTIYRADFDTTVYGFPAFTIHPNHFSTMALEENPLEFHPGSRNIRIYAPGHGLKTGDNVIIDARTFTTSNYVTNVNSISGSYVVRNYGPDDFVVRGTATGNASVISKPTRTGGAGISLVNSHNILFDTLYVEVPYYASGMMSGILGLGSGTGAYKVLNANNRTYEFGQFTLNKEKNFETTKVMLNPTSNLQVSIPDTNPLFPSHQNFDTLAIFLPINTQNSYVSPLIDKAKLKINLIKNLVNNPDFASRNYIAEDFATIAANSYTTSIANIGGLNTLARVFTTNASESANFMTLVPGNHITIAAGPNLSGTFRVIKTDTNGTNANIFISSIETRQLATTGVVNVVANTTSNALNSPVLSNVFTYTPNVLQASTSIDITVGRRFVDELAPRGGSTKSKYITREVKFANPSTSIFLKVDCAKPAGTNIRFFYRTKLTTDTEELADKHYDEFPIVTIPTSIDGSEYFEVETQIDNLPQFESLQIKIALIADEFAGIPPKVKNLRIISLA